MASPRLSGWDMHGVWWEELGEKEGEEGEFEFSLLPFYLHCLLREAHLHCRKAISSVPVA